MNNIIPSYLDFWPNESARSFPPELIGYVDKVSGGKFSSDTTPELIQMVVNKFDRMKSDVYKFMPYIVIHKDFNNHLIKNDIPNSTKILWLKGKYNKEF